MERDWRDKQNTGQGDAKKKMELKKKERHKRGQRRKK